MTKTFGPMFRFGFGIFAAVLCSAVIAQEQLKIGAIGPLSGGGTAWGIAIQRGSQLAIDEAMKAGGVKVGGKTYEPKLVMYDDAYTAAGGRAAAERLVNADGIKFILGPFGSGSVLGALAVTNKAPALLLSNGFAPTILKNADKAPYNFRITLSNVEFAPEMVKWMRAQKPELKKAGIIHPNDATGQTVVPTLMAAYKAQGFEVWTEGYERGSKEFAPLIARMIAQGVDLMDLNSNAPGEAGLLVKQAREAGYDKVIWQVGGPSVEEIVNVAGRYADGFISYNIIDFEEANAAPLVKAYREKYGSGVMDGYVPIFYNATKVLLEAIRRAGSTTDVQKVRDSLEKLDGYDAGIYGPVVWGGMAEYGVNHQLLTKFWITEVKNGKLVTRAAISPAKR
ncbi:MAG: ABC transporter substrate-binding protein [Acidovorax sp.]|uniref:ABC transporter substrate-binding protein n=1 Tax=Acidovorax sp. TaxID=1872122 RepID=UPI00391A03FA